ncbi:MAG: formylglycine-generating enzyme family protein [Planctomycetota bacterium]|nr:formylglycine-generating enzyme family protein [Planctomycetota bacterium]
MKRILGIAVVLGLVGALTVMAQEVKPGKTEVIDLGNDVKLEMVLIPAGKFMMGSPASEVGRVDNETQHEVTLTKPFYMGKYEVTQGQWEEVMGHNPSKKTIGAKLPVTDVSWNESQKFIIKLNNKTKANYRLPTEAEWEYACKAGTTTAYFFGDKITPKDANYDDSKINDPVVIGSYKPNAFGLYDMHGNVWEWCEDWYGVYPAGSATDPKGKPTGDYHIMRGGSFYYFGSYARSSYRYYNHPFSWGDVFGLRLAKTK